MWSSPMVTRLTPDHVDHHPVRRGVGGHAGVVSTGAGARVRHCQPALERNKVCPWKLSSHKERDTFVDNDKSFEMRKQLT